ncbi:unnamed protein product [Lota lota]
MYLPSIAMMFCSGLYQRAGVSLGSFPSGSAEKITMVFEETQRLFCSSFPWVRVTEDRQQANCLLLPITPNQPKPQNAVTIAVSWTEEIKLCEEEGIEKYVAHHVEHESEPLKPGAAFPFVKWPLNCFLEALGKLQRTFYAKNERLNCPIRTYLVTARSAASSGARVLKTLRSWGLEIYEVLFLTVAPKGPLVQKIKPHIYFNDQMFHIEEAKEMGTISAHVPYRIGQKYNKGKLIEQPAK